MPNEAQKHRRLARELLIGSLVAASVWLILLRLLWGEWSYVFPLIILGYSWFLALALHGPAVVARPAWKFWQTLIALIDWVVTRVVCLLLFFLLFTPLGLLLRLFRLNWLQFQQPHDRASFWREIPREREKPEQLFRQY